MDNNTNLTCLYNYKIQIIFTKSNFAIDNSIMRGTNNVVSGNHYNKKTYNVNPLTTRSSSRHNNKKLIVVDGKTIIHLEKSKIINYLNGNKKVIKMVFNINIKAVSCTKTQEPYIRCNKAGFHILLNISPSTNKS